MLTSGGDVDVLGTDGVQLLVKGGSASINRVTTQQGSVDLTVSDGGLIVSDHFVPSVGLPANIHANDGLVLNVAGSIGSANDAVLVDVDQMILHAGGNAAHLRSLASLDLKGISGGADLIDIFSLRGLELSSDIATDADSRIALTSQNGDVTSKQNIQVAGDVTLTALNGAVIGSDGNAFRLTKTDNNAMRIAASGGIWLAANDNLNLDHAVSRDASVILGASNQLSVDLLGSHQEPVLTGQAVSGVLQWGRDEPLQTLPFANTPLQNSAIYPSFDVVGPSTILKGSGGSGTGNNGGSGSNGNDGGSNGGSNGGSSGGSNTGSGTDNGSGNNNGSSSATPTLVVPVTPVVVAPTMAMGQREMVVQ